MKKHIIIITLFILISHKFVIAQNWFTGSSWNYRYDRTTSYIQYVNLGSCISQSDTVIENKLFSIIKSNTNTIDYLYESNKVVYYFKKQQILKLFDFSKSANDSFLIDMYFSSTTSDTIIKNVLVKVKETNFLKNISNTDSLKSFRIAILSDNVRGFIGNNNIPFDVPTAITEKLILAKLANYYKISLTELCNQTINLGMDSKPILSCYKNETTGFMYKDSLYILKNLPCDYSSGMNELMAGNHTISLFPNPSKNILNIQADEKKLKSIINIQIVNANGQNFAAKTKNSQIDISQLTQGLYFLIVNTENGNYKLSFVKE